MNSSLFRSISVAFASAVIAATSSAQNFAIVNKEARYVQTGPTTILPRADQPFRFLAQAEGSATNPAPPNTVTLPNNAGTRTLIFSGDQDGGGWRFEQVLATQAALTAAYPNGTYVLTLGGRSANVPINGDLYPGPVNVTVSGGTFINGVLVVERAVPLTITATYPAGFVAGAAHIGANLSGSGGGTSFVDFGASNDESGFTQSQVSFTVPANTLSPGGNYQIEAEANRLVSSFDVTSIPGFTVVGVYSSQLRIAVSVSGPAPAPVFVQQPSSQTVATGSTVVFTALANNATNYQWRRDGVNIAGATSATLVLSGANVIGGNYSVVASNVTGSTPSSNANLNVSSAVNFGRLINLAILTDIREPGDSFTLGYVVGGAGPGTAKPLVIRAVAPSLAALGVAGTVNDPKIEIFAGATKTSENDNWGGSTLLANAFVGVGAFPYVNPSSLDAAVLADVTTRDNSIKVSAAGAGTGTVLAEIYDATPNANVTATTPRLLNVAVLKVLNPGTSMTAGFVLRGQTSRTVLIRAIGPGLNAVFGIPDAMSDPTLTLFGAASARLAENDNWGGDPAIGGAAASVGAFAIVNPGSRDAMLLRTLPPGDYTVEVRGVAGGGGNVIVEVYEVP